MFMKILKVIFSLLVSAGEQEPATREFPRIIRRTNSDPAAFGTFVDALIRYEFCRATGVRFKDSYCDILLETDSCRNDISDSYRILRGRPIDGVALYLALLDICEAAGIVNGKPPDFDPLRREILQRIDELNAFAAEVHNWALDMYQRVEPSPRFKRSIADCIGTRKDGSAELIEFKCSQFADRAEWWAQLNRYLACLAPRTMNRLVVINPIQGSYTWRAC
ncbi:MAG: hypothetical protein ACOVS5_11320 [Oligoflexus sp.]